MGFEEIDSFKFKLRRSDIFVISTAHAGIQSGWAIENDNCMKNIMYAGETSFPISRNAMLAAPSVKLESDKSVNKRIGFLFSLKFQELDPYQQQIILCRKHS